MMTRPCRCTHPQGRSMSYPSFHTYIRTLKELIRRKNPELAEESAVLAKVCSLYGRPMGLPDRDIRTLLLAAYFKNLGATTISDRAFSQSFDSYGQLIACVNSWFDESTKLAEMAGLPQVALVLGQYYQRAVPQDPLARVFQVFNAWVACHQKRGWRVAMSDREALIVLKQRAILAWSDSQVVNRFIKLLPVASTVSQQCLETAVVVTAHGNRLTLIQPESSVRA